MADKVVGTLQIRGGMFNKTRNLYEERCSTCGKRFKSIFPKMANRPIYCPTCVGHVKIINRNLAKLEKDRKRFANNPRKLAQTEGEIAKLNRIKKPKF